MSQIHPEAYTALMTDRPEILNALRTRLEHEGKMTQDVDLLLSALYQAVESSCEARRRLAEIRRVLRDQTRSLLGAARQSEALQEVLEHGGTYQNAVDRTEKLWPADLTDQGG